VNLGADITQAAPTTRDHNSSKSPARSMDKHRTRFLASLSARLEQDRAVRESEDDAPAIWHRPTERHAPTGAPAPAEAPEPTDRAADLPNPHDPPSGAQVVSMPGPPEKGGSIVKVLRRREPDRGRAPTVPWSETGMSPALRDAIASVRRVANHEMPPPQRADVRHALRVFHDDPDQEHPPFDGAGADERPSPDDQGMSEELPIDHVTAIERFDDQARYEEPPLGPDTTRWQQAFDRPAAQDDWAPDDRAAGRSGLDEDAPDEELWFEDGAESPPSGDRSGQEGPPLDAPASPSLPFGDDGADEQRTLDDVSDQEAPQVSPQARRPRAAPGREGTQRRRLHLAALALAPIVVLVAGFGLGILSGAQEFDRLLVPLGWTSLAEGDAGARHTDSARPLADPAPPPTTAARDSGTDSAPPPTDPARAPVDGAAAPAEPAPSPQLSELETVRVGPLAAPPRTEPTPAPARSDLPLPPPPKPAPWSSMSQETSSASDRLEREVDTPAAAAIADDGAVDDAVEDAAVALLEADGAGGTFEPILVKTSISGPQVFVHYTESAPGGPATAVQLVRHLREAGFAVESRAVDLPISAHSVRYFFDSDRDDAQALSAQVQRQVPGGAAVPVVDFTDYQPRPRRGHLEIWLGG
jgi:hypothetical protein